MSGVNQRAAELGHEPRYRQFVRGRTPIRPQRTLYGTVVRCTCGYWEKRVNEGRKRAEQLWRGHRDSALEWDRGVRADMQDFGGHTS